MLDENYSLGSKGVKEEKESRLTLSLVCVYIVGNIISLYRLVGIDGECRLLCLNLFRKGPGGVDVAVVL